MPRTRTSRYARDYRVLLDLLREYRKDAEVTQVDLAASLKTSQSVISKLEQGVVRMDLMELLGYLDAIKVDPVEFLGQFLAKIGRR